MPLLPEIEALLQDFTNNRGKPIHEMTVQECREFIKSIGETCNPLIETPDITSHDLLAKGRHGNIPIRVYNFKEHYSKHAIIYTFGGGFVTADLDNQDFICRKISELTKQTVFSIEYRLAPEYKFPVGQEDVYDAIKWLYANRQSFPFSSLTLVGYSSGATYTAIVSRLLKQENLPIQSQVLICPCTDFTASYPSREENAKGYLLDKEDFAWHINHYLPQNIDLKRPDLSPLYETNLKDTPKTLIISAEYCPLRDEAKAYAEKLKNNNIPVQYSCYKGQLHAMLLFIDTFVKLKRSQNPLFEIVDFIASHPLDKKIDN